MLKKLYETPTTETIVVRSEGVVCVSNGATKYHSGGASYYDDGDTNNNGDY